MSITYPVLPLRDIVVFPHMIVPLFVGREKSVKALENVMANDKKILLVSQRDANDDDPDPEDIFDVGTIATVMQLLKLPDGTVKVLVEGGGRAKITRYLDNEDFFEAEAEVDTPTVEQSKELQGLIRSVIKQFEQYIKFNKKIPSEVQASISQIEDPEKLADVVASYLSLTIAAKQELLENFDLLSRL